MHRSTRIKIASAVAVATFGIAGAVVGYRHFAVTSPAPRLFTSQSFYLWGDTPRDWVGWADRIAVVRVTGESSLALDPRLETLPEGEVGRTIRIDVEQTLWQRDASARLPESLSVRTTDGWWYKDGTLYPLKDAGSHRAEVGDRLVVAMFESEEHGWTLMAGGIPVGAGARLTADPDQTDLGRALDGSTLPQLEAALRTARPFPEVAQHQHLRPDARMVAVREAQRAARGTP